MPAGISYKLIGYYFFPNKSKYYKYLSVYNVYPKQSQSISLNSKLISIIFFKFVFFNYPSLSLMDKDLKFLKIALNFPNLLSGHSISPTYKATKMS